MWEGIGQPLASQAGRRERGCVEKGRSRKMSNRQNRGKRAWGQRKVPEEENSMPKSRRRFEDWEVVQHS